MKLTDEQRAANLEFGCPYVICYVGRCNALKTDSGFCKQHTGKACSVCGSQATNECSHTGQFVCGAPLCADCEGFVDQAKASGSWGFMNHGHRRKPVERRVKPEPRKMLAEDIGWPAHD